MATAFERGTLVAAFAGAVAGLGGLGVIVASLVTGAALLPAAAVTAAAGAAVELGAVAVNTFF